MMRLENIIATFTGYSSLIHFSLRSSSEMGVKGNIWMQWINSTYPPNQVA